MKYILILVLSLPLSLFAQGPGGGTLPGQVCGIYYDYDAAGNRIKRYYDCKTVDPEGPVDPPPDPGTPIAGKPVPGFGDDEVTTNVVTVFPNPAQSYADIRFRTAVKQAHFHLYDAKGGLMHSGNISGSTYRLELSGYADGTYLIVIKDADRQHRFKIVLKH